MTKIITYASAFLLFAAGYILADSNCPFGLTDDPAPGQCGLYVDGNGDNLCDNSQDTAQSGGASPGGQNDQEQAKDQTSSVDSSDDALAASDDQQTETLSPVEADTQTEIAPANAQEVIENDQPMDTPARPRRPNYHPWLLLFITIILAIAGEIWQKQDKKKIGLVQIIWNWMLLISFLAGSLTGIYFILPPDSRPVITFNISYWHTVTGLVFIYIGLYHVVRRAACLIRGSKNCTKQKPCC